MDPRVQRGNPPLQCPPPRQAGITGRAQANGLRGDTDLVERIKCDLYYIENWKFLWDFQIMVLTFFKRDNAC
jgi:lipopolysaccharide/colanic/teichoic acid biosynthesis glycosyltransferase